MKHLTDGREKWAELLDGLLFAYRTSVHASTGYTPFFLVHGRQPRLPIDVAMENKTSFEAKDGELNRIQPDFDSLVEQMKRVRKAAAGKAFKNIEKAQAIQKKHYDKRHSVEPLKHGEKVKKQTFFF